MGGPARVAMSVSSSPMREYRGDGTKGSSESPNGWAKTSVNS